jgi:RNA 2',3'-cyclic 3'-phosphodiesterase
VTSACQDGIVAAMHRLFVAIRPPGQVRDLLIDTMDESPALGWVGEDNLHLTLRFIGEVERPLANDLAVALERVRYPAFDLAIRGTGRFDRRGGGALWAGVEPRKPVAELAAKVERACQSAGIAPERRAFHPHITLARYNRHKAEEALDFERRNAGLASEPFAVDRFTLFESHLSRHGAHYAEIADYRLR